MYQYQNFSLLCINSLSILVIFIILFWIVTIRFQMHFLCILILARAYLITLGVFLIIFSVDRRSHCWKETNIHCVIIFWRNVLCNTCSLFDVCSHIIIRPFSIRFRICDFHIPKSILHYQILLQVLVVHWSTCYDSCKIQIKFINVYARFHSCRTLTSIAVCISTLANMQYRISYRSQPK